MTPLSLLLKLSPKLFFIIYRKFLSRPGFYNLGEEEKKLLHICKKEHYTIPALNKKVKLYRFGSGPKILLIHGWGGRGLQLYPFISPLLDSGFSVTTLDFPAHGESDGKTTSVFEFVHTLREILENENFDGFVAHSVGCSSLLGSLLESHSTKPIILFAPHYDLKQSMMNIMEKRGIPNKTFLSLMELYENHYGIKFKEFNPKDLVYDLSSPFLIYHDKEDGALPHTHSEGLAQTLKYAQLNITQGLGHNRILKDKNITKKSVQFLINNIPNK